MKQGPRKPCPGDSPPSRTSCLRRDAGPAWLVASLLLMASGIGRAAEPATAAGPALSAPVRPPLVTVVAGIVGYTRWPGEAVALRLCTLGDGHGVDELLRAAELGTAQRSVRVRTASGVHEASRSCDAVYVGDLAATVRGDLLHELVGRPVLLLGEGAAFCSDGGMFCLDAAQAPAVRFQANLDAIARSGLRVNPMVLRIARQPAGSGS